MRQAEAVKTLADWSSRGKHVFTRGDLRVLFHEDREDAFNEGLRRLVRSGLLLRIINGIYVYPLGERDRGKLLEAVASECRRMEQVYISLESALSMYGIISQIPIDTLTVMTTGRKGRIETPWGTIEFTHTARPLEEIIASTVPTDGPLRLASPQAALRDLCRVGRNTHLIQEDEVEDALKEFEDRHV